MKESLQEATQRALIEGYKNLRENKKVSKKVESLGQQDIIKYKGYVAEVDEPNYDNKNETIVTIYNSMKDYKNGDYLENISLNNDDLEKNIKSYIDDTYDEKTESKKVEAIDKEKVLNMKYDDLPDMCYGLLPSDNSVIAIKKGKTGYYETDYGIVENPEEFVNKLNAQMGITPEQRMVMELRSMSGNWKLKNEESKKVEAKEDTASAPDYLEKAFEVEVEYWLKALVDEDSNDEIGKKAQEVLDDKNKMKEIVNELVDGSDDLWEDIHRRIEELAGLHYRESSRVNESKKVTEGLIDSVADYIILRDSDDYKSNDPWQELFVFDHKLSDEEKSKIQKAIDEAKQVEDYDNELVEQKINEVVPYVSNEILSFDGGKIFYF